MENCNLSIKLPLVLIRATENVKKKLQCISEFNAIQLRDLGYTVHEETFNGLFDNPVLLAGRGFHLCRQHRHTQVYIDKPGVQATKTVNHYNYREHEIWRTKVHFYFPGDLLNRY